MIDFLMPLLGKFKALRSSFNTHTAATTAHGAVSAPTANKLVIRDANGRAQVADPTAAADIVTKGAMDTALAAQPRVTQVNAGAGLEGGPITSTGSLSLTETGVTPGVYSRATIEVDVHGRIISASTGSLPTANTSVAGIVELANDAEVDVGTDTARAVTPSSLSLLYLKKDTAASTYASKSSGSAQTFNAEVRAPTFQISSGRHLKKNIRRIRIPRSVARKIKLYAYEMIANGRSDSGVIADEVARYFPNCVSYDEEGRAASVDYGKLAVHLALAEERSLWPFVFVAAVIGFLAGGL